MDRARKRPIVYAIRDFPPGCGTAPSNVPDKDHFKTPRTSDDVVVENPSPDHSDADSEPSGASLIEEQKFRTSKHDRGLKQESPLRSSIMVVFLELLNTKEVVPNKNQSLNTLIMLLLHLLHLVRKFLRSCVLLKMSTESWIETNKQDAVEIHLTLLLE